MNPPQNQIQPTPTPAPNNQAPTTTAAEKIKKIAADALVEPVDYEAKARKLRKKRSLRLVQKFSFFVILPTIATAIYFVWFAKDQYQSECSFSVQTAGGKPRMGLESIIGTLGASSSGNDSMTIKKYILSRDMLTLLDNKLNFIKHYQRSNIDWLARLPHNATFEDAFEYYKKVVEIEFDTESKLLILRVKAFSAQKAQQFSSEILKLSEKKVNQLTKKIQQDQVAFSQDELKVAERRLTNAQKALLALQRKESDFNPGRSVASLLTVKNQLEAELAQARTELYQLRAVMAPSAPKVIASSQRVRSLKNQIKQENSKLLGTEDNSLGASMAEFEMAMLEKEFAQKEYEAAMVSFKLAKLEAMKQSRYLTEISSPSKPDTANYPESGMKIFTAFMVSLCIFGIASLLLAAVKEHARV